MRISFPANRAVGGPIMRYDRFKEFIEGVKASSDIVEIVRSRIPLDSSLKAKCPFHEDRNPNFSVNAKGQYFFCFGCGVAGDVIKFLMLYERKRFGGGIR